MQSQKNKPIKNALITGGSNGLGKTIALKLASENYNVVFTYRSDHLAAQETLASIQSYNVKAKAIQVDLSNLHECDRVIQESYEFLGEIDVLVNNAGEVVRKEILDHTLDEVERIFKINVMSPFMLISKVSQRIKEKQFRRAEQDEKLKKYCIINITSISRDVPTGIAAYESTKSALHQLTRSAAFELAQFGICVNSISPGLIPTKINQKVRQGNHVLWKKRVSAIPMGRAGEPKDIAEAALFIINSNWITGSDLTIDGGRSVNYLGGEIAKPHQESSLMKAKL